MSTNYDQTSNRLVGNKQLKQNRIKLFHLNIQSIKNRNHLIQIRQLVSDNKVDVLAISETWLNSSILNAEVEIQGYRIHRLDRKYKRGGGVCIYVRNNLKSKVLKDLSYISNLGLHQLWVQIQLNKNKSIIVCVTYKPPNCPVTCIKDEFKSMFIEAFMMQPQIVIMGDLNCNLLNNSSVEVKVLLDTCNELNLSQIIKEPTRITAQTRSLLDVIMVTPLTKIKNSGVINTGISDHYLVYCIMKVKSKKPNPKYIHVRSYKRYDRMDFKREVAHLPLYKMHSTHDVNSKLDLFNELFLDTLNRHAPMKYVKIKGRPHKFISKEIKQLMKNRDQCLKSFRKSKNLEDWNNYKQLKNAVKLSITKAKSNYVYNQIEKNKDNSKSMWKVIRGCLPSKERTKQNYRKDPELVAEEFNNFFISVGKTTTDKVREQADENNTSITYPSPRLTHISDAERFRFSLVT